MSKPWESNEYCGRFGIHGVVDLWSFDVSAFDLSKDISGVYVWRELRHKKDEQVLYVGQAWSLIKRVKQHTYNGSIVNEYIDWKIDQRFIPCKKWRSGCDCIPRYKVYLLMSDRDQLDTLESDLIFRLEPILNSPERLKYWMYDTWGTVFINSR